MIPIQPEYISLVDLGMAYRKAKVDLYYTGDNSILKVLEYEEKLIENLNSLHKKLLSKDLFWLHKEGALGGWTLAPKCIVLKNNSCEGDLIHSDQEKQWKNICESLKSKPTAEFRLMAAPSMDFHVLSALWMSKVGHKYDKLLSDCACGNRLRRQSNGEFNLWSNGTFQPYLKPFRDWRDNGIKSIHTALDESKSIVAITADIKSFYHELNPDFIVNPEFLNIIGLPLNDEDSYLTKVFVQALKIWAKCTPLKKGLPVGLPASALVANMALFQLDQLIQKEIVPLYYGRYVDDSAPRRRTGGRKSSVQPSCTRDEGGPFGVAVQAETSNHLLLLHLRDVVVSESGKGRARPCQIRTVESNANEPLMTCRKRRNDVKTGRESLTRDKSGSNLLTGQTASGIKAARTRLRLLCGTWEPVTPMLREKHKERSSKCQSTDAGYRGGVTCSSDEGSVMELERRGYPIRSETREQPVMGGFA